MEGWRLGEGVAIKVHSDFAETRSFGAAVPSRTELIYTHAAGFRMRVNHTCLMAPPIV